MKQKHEQSSVFRWTSLVLTVCMLFGCVGLSGFAANAEALSSAGIEADNSSVSPEAYKPIALKADDAEVRNSKFITYIGKESFEAAGHIRRVPELEELGTYVFDNIDGTRTVYFMGEDVKFVDENGEIKEKDITLKSTKGGYAIGESNVELFIPAAPTSGIEVGYSGYSVKLVPENTLRGTKTVSEDNSVLYQAAFGAKTHLRYTPTLSGIKEDIILDEYVANATYSFILETNGLSIFSNKNGYYLAEKAQDEAVFHLGDVFIYDAIGKPDTGRMTVSTVEAGQKYRITISANDEFLRDPETVYPVTIDPTLTISENSAGTAIEDAVIFDGKPDRNFGDYTYNYVGTTSNSSYGVGRTVVRLTGLIDSMEYMSIHDDDIISAYFYAKESTGTASQYINLYPSTNTAWNEADVTWNTAGGYVNSENYGANLVNGRETAFDITELVKDWKNGDRSANAGFVMISSNESARKSFYSSDHATASARPRVVMTFDNLSLNVKEITLEQGESFTLEALTFPTDFDAYWISSEPNVVLLSQSFSSCVVVANQPGTTTVTVSGVDGDGNQHTDYCIVKVYRLPNPDAQNKTGWCWAAASKMVGIHNAMLNDVTILLQEGVGVAEVTDGMHSPFYGEDFNSNYTVDLIQQTIVKTVKNNYDFNSGAENTDEIEAALRLVTSNQMSVGTVGTGNYFTSIEIEQLNNEMASGRWVVGCLVDSKNKPVHAVVIRECDSLGNFKVWDPYIDDEYYTLINLDRTFDGKTCHFGYFIYCR